MGGVVRVLIVDDSAYVRKVIKQMLSRSPFLEVVGAARDGLEALQLVEQLRPDVITLDLMMPELDGIAFLREQMTRRPVPVVVVSIANDSSGLALAALDAGAVDVVQKPTALATEKIFEISDDLIAKVKAAATIPQARLYSPQTPHEAASMSAALQAAVEQTAIDIVVLGVSTGGPQALKVLVPQLPATFPVPIAVVLHMPVGYTALYAQKLNDISQLHVIEAQEGDVLRPGVVLLAPAGRHLTFRRRYDGSIVAHLDTRPFDIPYRPSVDVLFRSAADIYQSRVLGVVMTGMGRDGKEGAAIIKGQGGMVFTEAEETCIVYGMPRSVVEAGLSDKCVRLENMAQSILEVIRWQKS